MRLFMVHMSFKVVTSLAQRLSIQLFRLNQVVLFELFSQIVFYIAPKTSHTSLVLICLVRAWLQPSANFLTNQKNVCRFCRCDVTLILSFQTDVIVD